MASKQTAVVKRLVPNASKTSFFDLPAEIRNDIYALAVIEEQPIAARLPFKVPPITQVCHQTRIEALPVFYAGNHFDLDIESTDYSITNLRCWLNAIGSQSILCIRKIHVPKWVVGRSDTPYPDVDIDFSKAWRNFATLSSPLGRASEVDQVRAELMGKLNQLMKSLVKQDGEVMLTAEDLVMLLKASYGYR